MKEYNVFISYKTSVNGVKTKDSDIALEIYRRISAIEGAHPFLDVEELHKVQGNSDFNASIFDALASAKIFIYVCTNPAFLRTSFIEGEWSTYLGELNSGRKPRGSIFGVTENVNPDELPIGLRKFETLPFSPNSMDLLVKFVENRIQSLYVHGGSDPARSDWMSIRLDEIKSEEGLYPSRNASLFLDEFLSQEDCRLAFLQLDRTYHNTILLRAEALRLSMEYDVLFFYSAAEAGSLLTSRTAGDSPQMPTLVIVEQIYSTEEYREMVQLADYCTDCRFVCAAYEGVVHGSLRQAFSTVIHAPNNYELDLLINLICQDVGYPCSNSLIDKFMLPMYEGFRTPVLIGIVIRQLQESQILSYNNSYNTLLFYEMLDDYLLSIDPQIGDLIFDAVEVCTEKGMNCFLRKEVGGSDMALSVLIKHGILESVRNSYVFACEDYLYYKTAENLVMTYGTKCPDYVLKRGLEECLPFCITMMIQKYGHKLSFDFLTRVKPEHAERLIDFFLTAPQLPEIIAHPGCYEIYLQILHRSVEHGYWQIAKSSIDVLCQRDPAYAENKDIRHIGMIIDYYIDGVFDGVFDDGENADFVMYWVYKGRIQYCADLYEEAEYAFDRALSLAEDDDLICRILMEYAEVLADSGRLAKLDGLLNDYHQVFYRLQDYENYYIYKGDAALSQMNLEDAYDYYSEAYGKMISHYKANTVARIFGNMGLTHYYRGNSKNAERLFAKNLDICIDSENFNGIAISRMYLCLQCLFDGRADEAYAFACAALFYANKANNSWRIHQIEFLIDHFTEDFGERLPLHIAGIESIASPQYHSDSYILLLECMLRSGCAKEDVLRILDKADRANKQIDCMLNAEIIRIYKTLLVDREDRVDTELSAYGEYAGTLAASYARGERISVIRKVLSFSNYREMETERLELRHLSDRYASGIFGYASRVQPTKFVFWERHKTLVDTYAYIKSVKEREYTGEYMLWVLTEKQSGKVIGTIDLTYSEEYGGVEFGIILSDFYWHKGYAGEALRQIIEFSETDLGIDKLVGVCVNGNRNSEKLMRRNGFEYVRTIEDYHRISSLPDRKGLLFIKELGDRTEPE